MERREFIALLGLATAMMPSAARAETTHAVQPQHAAASYAGRLIGAWDFVSSVNTRRDGSTFDRWGENPRGIFMFDRGGRYAQIIVGGESRVFGSKVYAAFGDYTVDEAGKTLTTTIEACSASKFTGTAQVRTILLLTADELKYSNPLTVSGATAEVLWRRFVDRAG